MLGVISKVFYVEIEIDLYLCVSDRAENLSPI
jgi:hypothetical protein